MAYAKVGNPNAKWMRIYDEDKASHEMSKAKHAKYYAKLRSRAIEYVLKSHGLSEVKCMKCGCDAFEILEVNHVKGQGGRIKREFGAGTWLNVLRSTPEVVREYFDILCKVCNQAHYVEFRFGIMGYSIRWKNQVAAGQLSR